MEAGHTDFALLEEGRIIRLRSTANHLRVEASPSLPAPEETDEEVAQTPEAGSAEEEFGQLFDEGETPEMVETSFEEMAIAVVSDEEFDQLQVPGVRDVSQVPVSSDDMVARLITEIQRTFAGYLLRNPIDRIIVTEALELRVLLLHVLKLREHLIRVWAGLQEALKARLLPLARTSLTGARDAQAASTRHRLAVRERDHHHRRLVTSLQVCRAA